MNEHTYYDWLDKYEHIKPYTQPFIKETDSILMIGCGNSSISFKIISFWLTLNT
jgi:hypothetical protein